MARTAGWHFGGMIAGNDEDPGPHASLTGAIALVEGDACVRQSIMMLVSTVPGERVMRPDYGCPLHRIVFSPNDDTTAGLAIHYVRQALAWFEPRVDILHIEVDRTDTARPPKGDGPILVVQLHYRVRATQHSDTLAINLNLAGNRA